MKLIRIIHRLFFIRMHTMVFRIICYRINQYKEISLIKMIHLIRAL